MEIRQPEKVNLTLLQSVLAYELKIEIDQINYLRAPSIANKNQVFIGLHKGRKVIVKILKEVCFFNLEIAGARLLADYGIPAPTVLAAKNSTIYMGKPVMVEEFVEGLALNQIKDNEASTKVFESAGRMLTAINNIPAEGFGTIVVEPKALRGVHETWSQARKHQNYGKLDYLIKNKLFSAQELESLRRLEAETEIELPKSEICHGDYHGSHIYTDGEKIIGVIDFDGMLTGDRRYDIAISHFSLKPHQTEAFNKGYGPQAEDPAVRKYLALVAADKVVYRHSHGLFDLLPKALSLAKRSLQTLK